MNQPVGGIQWGGISIPRVGQEVIVEFEHGDPDRPIVVGRVYNGQSQPPYPLPQHKTRSVLKTLSSPGGGGYHEIRIEDKKGSEQIFLRAEKDADLRVLNKRRTFIGNHQHMTIGNADFAEYNAELHQTVGAASNEQIGQNLSVTVGQDLQIKVSGAQVTQVGNAVHIKVGSKAVIQGGMSLSIKAGAGFITLDPSGVSIMGPLVRINQGGGGGSAQAANPTLPGAPAEPDNAIPGAKLRAASGPITPVPEVIDFDKARAQLATFQQANTFVSPLVEECPECLLAAKQHASPSTTDDIPGEYATSELPPLSPTNPSIPWETSIWMDTPFYEKAFVATGYLFDQLNNKLKSVSEWHDDTVKAFDTIGEDPATPEPLRFATALLKLPAPIGTGLVSGAGAMASLITDPESRSALAEGVQTLYENPEMLVDAAKAFADKPAYEQASDVIVLASDVALEGKAAIKSGGKPRKTDALDARKKALGDRIAAKRVVPDNLTDAKNILAKRRKQIAANGYQPKYSDEELKFIAESGNIGSERYQVRFMETKYLDPDNRHLSGAMGRPMEGKGAKYWSTSFDQLEDADTDPKLISEKLGLTYDPQKNYTLVIVDTQKATPITGVKSVSATFDNVSDFANTELPAKFPKSFTDTVMTPEFQAEYAKHYKAAEKSGYLKKEWSSDKFSEYLNTTGLSEAEKELMIQRFDMHEKIGNNEDYLGNGLTKNNNSSINKQYGVVETLNFERKKVNLSQLDETDAITLLPGLKPI